MRYQVPPLTALHAFEASARLLSFSAAATELNLSQAAVSHRVRMLEQHLGFQLFERLPRSLRLTDMGRAYLPSVRKAFDELTSSTASLFGPVGDRSLTIRAPISYAILWLAPRLQSFLQAHPSIDIRVCSAIWAEGLTPEETDVDIRLGRGDWPGFEAKLIRNEAAVPLCSPHHYADGLPDSAAALADCPLVMTTGFEDLWSQFFQAAGVEGSRTNSRVNVDTSLAALELAATGPRCAMVLNSFAESFVESGRLVVPVEAEIPVELSHYLLIPDGEVRQKPETLLFQEWLLEEA
ncbi:LysR substrate-binding domain-containing protein [Pelagibius sp. Alg239-R121]|uniref:LysR substrate-binding domain-containing protein n=1 Tax=Pelagibius sp. Alg239-R121 TaxID=2993448 RepID=UPI0024A78268|nr:LysR substrate-binding domain-containing protein [Pelagibius sp. Alg239-R121]